MKTHLNRVNKCNAEFNKVNINVCNKYILQGLSYVEYKEIIDKNNNNIQDYTGKSKYDTGKSKSDTKNSNKKCCIYCGNMYLISSSLTRHLKSCKVKNSEIKLLKSELIELKSKLNEYEEENEELKYIISQKNQIIKDNKSLNKYMSCNNTINMNCNNNITNNIIINNYNTPNKDYIGYDIKKECIYTDYVYLMPIMKDLFFNKEHPENHSISYSNMRSGNMSVYNGNEWILQNRVDIINDIINSCDDILSEFINEIRDSENITYKQSKMINLYDKYISKYILSDEDYKSLNECIYMESKNLNIRPTTINI